MVFVDSDLENQDPEVNMIVKGGHELSGDITVKGSKNAALGLIWASLLNGATTLIIHAPGLQEVFTLLKVLEASALGFSRCQGTPSRSFIEYNED